MRFLARGFGLLVVFGALACVSGCQQDNEASAGLKGTEAPPIKDAAGNQVTGQARYKAQYQQQNSMKNQMGSSGYPGAK